MEAHDMREVCSPLNKPKGPTAKNAGKLPTSPGAFSNPDKYGSGQKRGDALASQRNPSDPDPFQAASRTGGTISIAWDARK
jgi:hypothetical protein